jgi:hypothetical protein
MGAGLAVCSVPLTLAAVAGVPHERTGIASALLNAAQQIGGSLGLAVLGTIAATVGRGRVTHGHTITEATAGGFATVLGIAGGAMLLAFLVVVLVIRVPKSAIPTSADVPAA